MLFELDATYSIVYSHCKSTDQQMCACWIIFTTLPMHMCNLSHVNPGKCQILFHWPLCTRFGYLARLCCRCLSLNLCQLLIIILFHSVSKKCADRDNVFKQCQFVFVKFHRSLLRLGSMSVEAAVWSDHVGFVILVDRHDRPAV